MTESNFDFDIDIEKNNIERVLGIDKSRFYELVKEEVIVPSGRKEGNSKMYWVIESSYNYMQKSGAKGKVTAGSKERKEVQNSLDEAREDVIRHDLSVKRGETANTALMREIISRTLTIARNKVSGIKPQLRSKYEEVIDPAILDEIDIICSSACTDISNLDLDTVFDVRELINDEF